MIKWCLHLPFFQSLAAQKSSTYIFWSPAFASTVGPQLLVFSAIKLRFLYSKQPSNTNRQTNKQTWLRTIHHSKGEAWKGRTGDVCHSWYLCQRISNSCPSDSTCASWRGLFAFCSSVSWTNDAGTIWSLDGDWWESARSERRNHTASHRSLLGKGPYRWSWVTLNRWG